MLLSAVLGAVLSLGLTMLVTSLCDRRHHDRTKLYGTWLSTWQLDSNETTEWATERVTVNFNWLSLGRFGPRLWLVSSENSHGYSWISYANLVNGRDLIGSWHSVKPGAHSAGVMAFTLAPQGTFMYGYGFGPCLTKRIVVGAWVLGRTEDAVQHGKDELRQSRSLDL
jgi:hypothetical protein